METEPTDFEQASPDDESVEEFKEEMENDPPRASSEEVGETDLDRLRGG